MDFLLPIRSVTSTVDYFTPLHVDTNIEYCMDMEKFHEINNTSHYCEPALIVATNSYLPSDLCDMELTSFSDDGDISLDFTQDDFHDLLETLDDLEDSITQDITTRENADSFILENLPDTLSTENSHLSFGDSGNQDNLKKGKRKRPELELSEDMPCLRRPKMDFNIATHVRFDSPTVQTLSREC